MRCARKNALIRGRTDCISLTHNLDFSPLRAMVMQKFTVNSQSVSKIEWKQTDRQTDGGDRITCLANAVGKNVRQFT